MSIKTTQEADGVRISTDRAGERAVSSVLSRDEAVAHMEQLAAYLGFTVTPSGSSGDAAPADQGSAAAPATADVAAEDTGTQTGDTA